MYGADLCQAVNIFSLKNAVKQEDLSRLVVKYGY